MSHIVKGQDQVVDIDLDKDTAIRAPDRNYTPIDARSLWMQPFESIPSHEVLPLTEPVNALDREYPQKQYISISLINLVQIMKKSCQSYQNAFR